MRHVIAALSFLLFLIPMFPGNAAAQTIRCADVASDVPRTYSNGYEIHDLLTADFDGDGNVDVLALEWNTSIYYGRGDGSFEEPAVVTTYMTSAAIADVDADGLPDIVSTEAGSVFVYRNLGNRRFADRFGLRSGPQTDTIAAVRDFTEDGRPDILIHPADTPPVLLVNEGDRWSERAAATVVLQGPVAVGDLDHDGHLDLAGGVTTVNAVAYLRGDGKGQFTVRYLPPLIERTAPRVVADMNGDGREELVTITEDAILILYEPLDTRSFVRLPGRLFSAVRPADLNGDGATDLLAWSWDSYAQRSRVTVYQNDGHGGLTPRNDFAWRAPLVIGTAGAIADVNHDAVPDLIAGSSSFAVFAGRGDGTFRTPRLELPVGTQPLAALDLDGDGVDELITAGGSQLDVGTKISAASYAFERVPFDAESYSVTSIGHQLIAGSGLWLRVFSHDDAKHRWRETNAFKASGNVIALAALDAGKIAAVTSGICNAIQVYDLSGTLLQELPMPCGQRVTLQGIDFDRDGHRDLLAANSGRWVYDNVRLMSIPQFDGSVQLYRGRADGTLEPPITMLADRQIFTMSAGDFNGDRRIDIALSAVEKNSSLHLDVFHGDGSGGLIATSLHLPETTGQAAGDLNGDGIDDLVAHDGARTRLFFGTPTGLVQHPQTYSAGAPLIVRNGALELPAVVYSISPGEAGLMENACRPTRRRGARH